MGVRVCVWVRTVILEAQCGRPEAVVSQQMSNTPASGRSPRLGTNNPGNNGGDRSFMTFLDRLHVKDKHDSSNIAQQECGNCRASGNDRKK